MTHPLKIPEIFFSIEPPFDSTNIDFYRKFWNEEARPAIGSARLLEWLTTLLNAWQIANEAQKIELPRNLEENYPFLFHELTDRMPTFDKMDAEKVRGALKLFGISAPHDAMVDTVVMEWLNFLMFHAVKVVLERCIKTKKNSDFDTDAYLTLVRPYLATSDRNMAELLIAKVTLVAWERAIPLLDGIAEQSGQDEDIQAFAIRYKNWMVAEMSDKNRR